MDGVHIWHNCFCCNMMVTKRLGIINLTLKSKVNVKYTKICCVVCDANSYHIFDWDVHIKHNDRLWFEDDNQNVGSPLLCTNVLGEKGLYLY